ncbi:MAG: hypothetical protein ACOX88_09615, partial [Christensenellales bacterium]
QSLKTPSFLIEACRAINGFAGVSILQASLYPYSKEMVFLLWASRNFMAGIQGASIALRELRILLFGMEKSDFEYI